MIPSVRARPARSAAVAAAKEVISAKEPLIVISRRKTSKGNDTTSSPRVTPRSSPSRRCGSWHADVADLGRACRLNDDVIAAPPEASMTFLVRLRIVAFDEDRRRSGGLAIAVFVAVFAQGLKVGIGDALSKGMRGNVVVPSDLAGNPEAIFEVVQLPTGEIIEATLRKSSGSPSTENTSFAGTVTYSAKKPG
jgi:hypothetical protein